jgi:hypothetical protein
MSRATEQASDFTLGTPHTLASVTSSAAVTLYSLGIAAGSFAMFHLQGCTGHIRFTTASGDTVSGATTDTVDGSFNAATNATTPHISLADGERIRTRVPLTATHIAHIESATGGFLRVMSATGTG